MIRDIDKFLESHLLEDYLLGQISVADAQLVEQMMEESEKVRKAYDELQENVEVLAKKLAVSPPVHLKKQVLKSIPVNEKGKVRKLNFSIPAIAASLAFLAVLSFAFNMWNNNKTLEKEMILMTEELQKVKNDLLLNEADRLQMLAEIKIANNPNTQIFKLKGNDKAPDFESVAYWNNDDEMAQLKILSMPDLPENKCLQMWVDVDGVMLSLGVIPEDDLVMIPLPFMANAESLNVTIEPTGGSDHPTVSDLIANVII